MLVRTLTNGGSSIWLQWLEPWLWSIFQTTVIDGPMMGVYSFYSLGLTWFWENLRDDVQAMAEGHMTQAEIAEIHEEHVPIVAPEEDFGLDPIADDSDFNPDAGSASIAADDFAGGL